MRLPLAERMRTAKGRKCTAARLYRVSEFRYEKAGFRPGEWECGSW
jgi:hypothetical protein